jgi:hypothetical protein
MLTLPPLDRRPETVAAFSRLYEEAVAPGSGAPITYTLAVPKWQFLYWLCETQDVLLHGSGDPAIREFEPRQSNDITEFGNRKAVYAASDGLWPMYFAIVNREMVQSLNNACFRVVAPDGSAGDPLYFFSVEADLSQAPWRNGTVYILPRAGFEQQPRGPYQGVELEIAQWASLEPVRPLAQLAVAPEDFPFLAQIRSHEMAVLKARAEKNPEGFPWIEE